MAHAAAAMCCRWLSDAAYPGHCARAADTLRETVEADVSTRSVSITSGFTGTEIIIFGTVENSRQPSAEAGTYDVVVVVEGTPAPVVVRKKDRVSVGFGSTAVDPLCIVPKLLCDRIDPPDR